MNYQIAKIIEPYCQGALSLAVARARWADLGPDAASAGSPPPQQSARGRDVNIVARSPRGLRTFQCTQRAGETK